MKKLVFVLGWLFCSQLFAADVYYISQGNCQGLSGLLVSVEDNLVSVLNHNGDIQTIARNKIRNVLIYGVEGESFQIGKVSSKALEHLKKVSIFSSKGTDSFLAWPYKFVEDLTFFFDLQGKTRVISEDQIYRIEDAPIDYLHSPDRTAKAPTYYLKEYFPSCDHQQKEKDLRPIRILSDQVKIAELLTDYEKGQQYLSNLQDRTFLYPRPFLFEKRARFGIIIEQESVDSAPVLPLYFKWTSGKNYHFQSENIIGGYFSKIGPFVQSTPLIASHFKSHFLNGSFEGNIFGVAAGKELWDGSLGKDITSAIFPNFNYSLLMGFDYKKFRFQFGTIYFNLGFADSKEQLYREVLASQSSPIFKVQWTENKWKASLVYSASKYKNESTDISNYVQQNEFSSSTTITDMNYESRFFRFDMDYDIADNFNAQLHVINLDGEYIEYNSNGIKKLDFTQNSIGLTLTHQFSYYIAIKGRGYSIGRDLSFDFTSDRNVSDRINTWGGFFELLF